MSEQMSSGEDSSVTQDELRPVIEAVRQYGEAHPGILEQIWFEGPPHRVVALLAADDVTNPRTGTPWVGRIPRTPRDQALAVADSPPRSHS
jgi:hypothetical protein